MRHNCTTCSIGGDTAVSPNFHDNHGSTPWHRAQAIGRRSVGASLTSPAVNRDRLRKLKDDRLCQIKTKRPPCNQRHFVSSGSCYCAEIIQQCEDKYLMPYGVSSDKLAAKSLPTMFCSGESLPRHGDYVDVDKVVRYWHNKYPATCSVYLLSCLTRQHYKSN